MIDQLIADIGFLNKDQTVKNSTRYTASKLHQETCFENLTFSQKKSILQTCDTQTTETFSNLKVQCATTCGL